MICMVNKFCGNPTSDCLMLFGAIEAWPYPSTTIITKSDSQLAHPQTSKTVNWANLRNYQDIWWRIETANVKLFAVLNLKKAPLALLRQQRNCPKSQFPPKRKYTETKTWSKHVQVVPSHQRQVGKPSEYVQIKCLLKGCVLNKLVCMILQRPVLPSFDSRRWLNKEYLDKPKLLLGRSSGQPQTLHAPPSASSKSPSASMPIGHQFCCWTRLRFVKGWAWDVGCPLDAHWMPIGWPLDGHCMAIDSLPDSNDSSKMFCKQSFFKNAL